MPYGPTAGRGETNLARIGLGISNELRNRSDWQRWINDHNVRPADNGRDWGNVTDEIEIGFLVKRGINCVRKGNLKQCMTVWRCPDNRFSSNIATGPWTVLRDERLAEAL